jgi:ornithine cyclodeaminase
MRDDDLLILKGHEVLSLLEGREPELLRAVRLAYESHAAGNSSLPHSTFLRFPSDERNRIIALPAYLGDGFGVAGIKWVSSFPGNLDLGRDRASAVIILNSVRTGQPEAVIEGSVISAKRTAASAALAAQTLQTGGREANVGIVGCGLINFEIARHVRAACPEVSAFTVFDLDPERARQFAEKCRGQLGVEAGVAADLGALLRGSRLVSFATTAVRPHLRDLSACAPGSTVLHISLRDLAPEAILSCDNVVDDIDHVCRAQTSVHLAEQAVGHRDFIRCTLADVLLGAAPARRDPESVAVFSPFGLGVLDLAVAKYVRDLAVEHGRGSVIGSFLPSPWAESGPAKAALKV